MDRLAKLTAKLYPRWWRERYGEEFAALLEDARPGLSGTLDVLKGALTMQFSTPSTIKTLLLCAAIGAVCGIATTYFFTPQYSSRAVVSIRPPEGAPPSDITDTLNRYSQDVLSRQALSKVIANLDLYSEQRTKMPADAVLEMMKQNIRIKPSPAIVKGRAVPAFELGFRYPDAVAAQMVVNNLVSRYMDANIKAIDRAAYERGERVQPRPTLELIDSASLPASPIFPRRKNFAAAGFGAGTLLGGLAALALYLRGRRSLA